MFSKLRAVFFAAAIGVAPLASANAAAFLPVGPQNDVSYDTVVNTWGWSVIYRGDYNTNVSLSDLFAGAQQYVMLAAIHDGSLTFDVLAATTLADLQTYTPQNTTHLSNGAQWYYNGGSFGFAGANDTISQGSADVAGPDERDRLSWHGLNQDYGTTPTGALYGWRSGDNTWLNDSSDWDRVVLTASFIAGIPEPSTWAMMILGFAGLGLIAYRRKQNGSALAPA